jgi:hypothetical protein
VLSALLKLKMTHSEFKSAPVTLNMTPTSFSRRHLKPK